MGPRPKRLLPDGRSHLSTQAKPKCPIRSTGGAREPIDWKHMTWAAGRAELLTNGKSLHANESTAFHGFLCGTNTALVRPAGRERCRVPNADGNGQPMDCGAKRLLAGAGPLSHHTDSGNNQTGLESCDTSVQQWQGARRTRIGYLHSVAMKVITLGPAQCQPRAKNEVQYRPLNICKSTHVLRGTPYNLQGCLASWALNPLPAPHSLLLTGRHQLALLSRVMLPTASQSRASRLLRKFPHAGFQLRPEVADEALNGPGKRLAQSYYRHSSVCES